MSASVETSGNGTIMAFKTSQALQTKRYTVSSVIRSIDGTPNINEGRYWTQKLGLGDFQKYGSAKPKFAHSRKVQLKTKGSTLVQQVIFGPPALSKSPTLAVLSGPRVGLYGTNPQSEFSRALSRQAMKTVKAKADLRAVNPERQVQVGGNLATCGAFRSDGRLMAVGTDNGELRICDVTMRATLTTFATTSRLPTRCVCWLRSGQDVFTGSDDGIGRLWNTGSTIKTKAQLALVGHGDAIRCAAIWQEPLATTTTKKKKTGVAAGSPPSSSWWKELAFTGSYDHTIRMWNIALSGSVGGSAPQRPSSASSDRCLAVFDHGSPVEAVILMKSEAEGVPFWVISAGGTTIKVWNPVSSKCVQTIATQHRKTITTLSSVLRKDYDGDTMEASTSWRILSSSLDATLQFHSWDAMTGKIEHLYTTKMQGAITAVAMDEGGDRIAVGTTDGSVHVNVRGPVESRRKRRREPTAGTYSYLQRGMNAEANEDDYIVAKKKASPKLQGYDRAMKEFRYGVALDRVLASRKTREVIGVLEEIGRRQGLTKALSNRDEGSLEPLLSFVTRCINKPEFTPVLIGVVHELLNIYSSIRGQSERIDELFAKLKSNIRSEIYAERTVLKLIGQVEGAMSKIKD